MDQLSKDLLSRMYAELQRIAADTDNDLQQAEQSYYAVESAIRDLKGHVATHDFKDEAEEIRFFKEIKPMFLKELVYYTELYYIESNKPVGSTDSVKRYYSKILESLAAFFEKNRLLYNYYRSDKSDMDEIYFLRRVSLPPQQPVYTLDLDPGFCTPHSNRLGKILAFAELNNFLNQALSDEPQQSSPAENRKKPNRVWKAAVVSLFEVGLGIWKSGAVTQGPGGFQQFMLDLGDFFNVKVGNVSRVVLGMSYRKKGRTPFLRSLVEVTERTFDERDL
ncbi:RteC domain-containing protein [Pedobacter sp. ISL-68]|uniref:RteC domain-containing protein n=1 Tax=unclassified Pedobacter TaxID=2628915 RepID=UPI001BE50967|nr:MULTISPECIES: RteC domain-containing protein [unclassified Pedobacter]MBT2561306.1 RteC domain-containing protein [Pedobacter sp. ISL-64]MBT2590695.1 RteC domain-containing protein [Pedobacter sp. ISL-68]